MEETKTGKIREEFVVVVEDGISPLLGMRAAQDLRLLKVLTESICTAAATGTSRSGMRKEDFVKMFPKVFSAELLEVIFRMRRFDQHLYGLKTHVETYHQP